MKRPRRVGLLVGGIILFLSIVTFYGASTWQNQQTRRFFDGFFRAVQTQDPQLTKTYYAGQSLTREYQRQLFTYKLLGWEITRISGQPFPMDMPASGAGSAAVYHQLTATLYYRLPDTLIAPQGPYARVEHPQYGSCARVPVTLAFTYRARERPPWIIQRPDIATGENWVAPFEELEPEFFPGIF